MASTRFLTGLVIVAALAAAPLSAEQSQRRGQSERGKGRDAEQSDRGQRAVPRAQARDNENARRENEQRQQQAQRQGEARQYQAQRQYEAQRQREGQRQYEAQRQYETQRRYEGQRQRETRQTYDTRRDYGRPYYSGGGYGRSRAVPRIIRPTIVTVIPYRQYVYRPSLGLGVYYGSGGSYPYGYTPRGYYDPIPVRAYGGLRISGAPREAHVFADGYYVGIVNDFDGIFQHLNLEAGGHRIEIEEPGFETIAFDVMVQPGRTITLRADLPY